MKNIFCNQCKFIFIFPLFFWLSWNGKAQNQKTIDSLAKIYNTAPLDMNKAMALNDLAFEYRSSKPDTCILLAERALALSEKAGFEKGMAWAWNRMGLGYYAKSNYPQSLDNLQKSLALFEKTGEKRGITSSLNSIGNIYFFQSNYPLALEYLQKSLKLGEEIDDKEGIANSLNTIGNVYNFQSNYPQALDYHQRSLKIREEIGDKKGIAVSLNNIGNVYFYQTNYPLSLEYYQRSLKIREETNDKPGIANSFINIGNVYRNQGNYGPALECLQKSLGIYEEMKDKLGLATVYNIIGNLYNSQNNYPLALEYLQKSLKIREEIGGKQGITSTLTSIGKIYQKQADYDKSIEYALQGLQIAKEIKALGRISSACEVLYESYKLKGDFVKALEYHELYKTAQDSLFNTEKAKSIANLESKAEVERKQKEIELLNKNKELLEKDNSLQKIEADRQINARLALEKQLEADRLKSLAKSEKDKNKQDSLQNLAVKAQLEADRLLAIEEQLGAESKARQLEVLKEKGEKEFQQVINYLVLAVLLIVLVFAYFIYRSRQKEKKAREEITEQNDQIQQQSKELLQMNEEMKQQSEELSLTNENLVITNRILKETSNRLESSIRSAKTIQTAILPDKLKLDSLLKEYFVYYQPRDVVSGDFYWIDKLDQKLILVVADCTGHGVPGAFMTLIANTLLEKIVKGGGITDPSQILNHLYWEIQEALRQKETQNSSGMDASVIILEKRGRETCMTFSGAKSDIFYYDSVKKELLELKGVRRSIGGLQNESIDFENIELLLPEGSILYMGSDGLGDQNNMQRKKFGKEALRMFLQNHIHLPMEQQMILLDGKIKGFMEGTSQRDDILLIGMKV